MTTATIQLTAAQLRVASKSISRSLDVEARKMERTRPGTPVYNEAAESYKILDDIDVELRSALRTLYHGGDE